MRVSGQGQGSLRMCKENGCPVLSVAVITRHVSSSAARDESSLFFIFPLFFGRVVFLLVTTCFAFGVSSFYFIFSVSSASMTGWPKMGPRGPHTLSRSRLWDGQVVHASLQPNVPSRMSIGMPLGGLRIG